MQNLMTVILLFSVFSVLFRLNFVNAKECRDIDIRNTPDDLRILENCTAILGSLHITLLDEAEITNNPHNHSFPNLREITGHLLLFNVLGLNSLGKLFPNLTVIRGQQLILSYSLMIFGLPHITEVGLKSLISIQRGYVFIERCPALCYTNTIDWEALTNEDEQNLGAGKGNIIQDVDPICPTRESCRSCDNDNCWSSKSCQKNKTSHLIRGIKCHDLCLGGCVNSTAEGCYVCSGLKVNQTCVKECPKDLFVFHDTMRCVPAKKCRDAKLIPFNGECLRQCPDSYSHHNPLTKMLNESECYKCDIKCPQRCYGARITAPSELEYFRGCNIVHGSLSIKLGLNMTDIKEKLEQTLGAIETINGALMIYRSFSLTSLSFLRNLNLINATDVFQSGPISEDQDEIRYPYAIEITENDNLQTLFDWKDKLNFTIIGGGMSFHYNSKLCIEEIHNFQRMAEYDDKHDSIGYDTNGYDETCHATGISALDVVESHSTVHIYWSKSDFGTNKKLVGYFVYYLEAPARNITHYSGLDACSTKKFKPSKDNDMPMISKISHSEIWQSVFVPFENLKKEGEHFKMTLTNLKQYTQYAYYIRTQVSLKHQDQVLNVTQGQSPVKYFQTYPDRPRPPIVRTKSKTNTTLTLEWNPSTPEKELVQKYFIDVYEMIDDLDEIDKRNYCRNPKEVKKEQIVKTVEIICCRDQRAYLEFFQRDGNKTCGENDPNCELTYQYVLFHHHVEQALLMADSHKEPSKRYQWRRESYESPTDHNGTTDPIQRKFDHSNYYLHSHIIDDERTDSVIVPNLKPFHLYAFYVYACNNISNCSDYYFHSDRTNTYAYADNVGIKNKGNEEYSDYRTIYIQPPTEPNGALVAYEIAIYDYSRENVNLTCLTRKDMVELNYTYRFENLLPGTYFAKVRSLSLGQDGMYTEIIMEVEAKPKDTYIYILGISLALVFIFTLAIVGTYYKKCRGYRVFPNFGVEHLLRRRRMRNPIQEPLISDEDQPVPVRRSKTPPAPSPENIQMSILNSSVLSLDQPTSELNPIKSLGFHIHDSASHSQPHISITDRISRSFHQKHRGERNPHGSDTDESESVSFEHATNSFPARYLMDENDPTYPLL